MALVRITWCIMDAILAVDVQINIRMLIAITIYCSTSFFNYNAGVQVKSCLPSLSTLHIMDFLDITSVCYLRNASIERLCEDLNNIVGHGIWYYIFDVENTNWLWLVNDIFTTLISDKVLCG